MRLDKESMKAGMKKVDLEHEDLTVRIIGAAAAREEIARIGLRKKPRMKTWITNS
jgi:hypothetical protein